jgi:hypothetical protein
MGVSSEETPGVPLVAHRSEGAGRAVVGTSITTKGGPSISTSTTEILPYEPLLTELEQSTLLGFLAGCGRFTRDAYALDLRQFIVWCWPHDRRLFDLRRVDIECFVRR